LPVLFFPPGTAVAQHAVVNWFNLAVLGWIILIAALAIAAYLMHAKPLYIAIGCLALLGIGIITSASRSKPHI
jgi:hypothetical protein